MAKNYRVEFDSAKFFAKVDKSWKKNLAPLTEQIKDDCNRFVRVDQGALRDSSDTHSIPSKGKIIWSTPYARRVYFTGTPSKDVNPNASLMWCEKAKREYSEDWAKLATKQMGRDFD